MVEEKQGTQGSKVQSPPASNEALGTSYLITRGSDGIARGFYNHCQHRGAKLFHEEKGEGQTRFSCPYHAWTYNTNGDLTGIPRKDLFPCLDPKS